MSSLIQSPESPATFTSLPEDVAAKLRGLARRLRRLALLRGIGLLLAVSGAMIAAGLAADFFLEVPTALRVIWLGATGIVALVITSWSIIRPLLNRYAGVNLAAVVEVAHPALGERLSSLVELTHAETPTSWRGSALMLNHLTRETLQATAPIDFNSAAPAKQSVRIGLLGLAAVLLLAAPALFAPDGYRLMLTRFLIPWGNYERASDIYFDVPGGDRVAARGQDMTLRAVPHSRQGRDSLPREAKLEFTAGPQAGVVRPVEWSPTAEAFLVTIPHVQDDFQFAFAAGKARSRSYTVRVVDPPQMGTCVLYVQPPEYTKLPAESHDGAVGEITVFEHSRLRGELTFPNKVVAAEWLQGNRRDLKKVFAANDIEKIPPDIVRHAFTIAVNSRSARLEFTADQGGPFEFFLVDPHGFHNVPTVARSLRIRRDHPPEFIGLHDDLPMSIAPGAPLGVTATVRDDFAVSQLQLEIEFPQGGSQIIDAPAAKLGAAEVSSTFEVDLPSKLQMPGTLFTYRFRAADNRPSPGPQWVTSEPHTVLIQPDAPSAKEQSLAREHQRLAEELAEIHNETRQQQSRVAALKDTDTPKFLRTLATQQRQLAQRLEHVADTFDKRPVLSSLAPTARKIAKEYLQTSAHDITQAISETGEQRTAALQASVTQLDDADEALAELRRRFERLAALERDLLDLDRMAAQAQELSQQLAALQRRQAELAAQPESAQQQQDLQTLVEQQRQAEKQAAELAEQLKDLVEQHPEILEAARQARLQELGRLGRAAQGIADAQEELATTIEQDPIAETDATNEATQQNLKLITAQRDLAREAVDFARQAAGQLGPQSKLAQQALNMAQQAHRAATAAANGQAPQAAKAAQQAADMAQEMTTDQESLNAQAQALRQRQQELSQQFAEMAADPQRRQAAQQFGQKNLAAQTEELQRQLQESAQDLEAKPLNLKPQGEQTRQAEQETAQARKQMQQATESLKQNQSQAAGQQGHQAASLLNDVAQAIQQLAGEQQAGQGEMPAQPADDITQAMQQMQQAQQQMQQDQKQQSSPDQPANAESPQQGASEKMQQAADSLSQATESLQPGQGQKQSRRSQGQRSQQTGQAGSPGNTAGGSGSNAPADELAELREDFEKLSGRHWGELPGKLRTEILESALNRPGGDYANIIRRYFRELAKTKRQRTPASHK
ncbi:hypothetical protein CA54_17930 [Symmachiella macrocystis]|uniref:Uncharacterized protein n=1 Tax=Symmachiella macrocystis TaxID=2527985 RepID=A0A5C6BML8_9PLAN|nr:hypothetical protein [Symmachiella macrocystis]TWU12967.1 hypothetical protein CA54_17930 [Symmachiella macrocystis]